MEVRTTRSPLFERFSGACAIAAGVAGLAYSAAFVALLKDVGGREMVGLSSLFLLNGGLLAAAAAVGLYGRLRETDPGFALLALVLALAGALGAAIHGAYDLANFIEPPGGGRGLGGYPNAADPRGFMTFGAAALSLFVVGWLMLRDATFPRRLAWVALADAALLVVVYLGRLIILNPDTPVLRTAALASGFLVNPAFYVWLGIELRRGAARASRP